MEIDLELKKYLSFPCEERTVDPLKWWLSMGELSFPRVELVALKYHLVRDFLVLLVVQRHTGGLKHFLFALEPFLL